MSEMDATTPETEVASYSEDDAAADLLSRWTGKPEADPEETEQEGQPSEGEEPEAEQAEAQAEAKEETPEAETEYEVEFGGQTRRLPKGITEEVAREVQEFGKSLHSDYTKKTQEVAEVRKKADADAAQAQELLRMSHEHADLVADWRVVQRQIEQISQTDLEALSETDPLKAQQQMVRMMQLQQAQQRIGAQLQTTVQQISQQQAASTKEKLAAAEAKLRAEIKDWGPQTQQALRQYGQSQGFTDSELSQVADPRIVLLMHKAQQFDAFRASTAATVKKVSQPAKTLKPSAAGTTQSINRAKTDDAMKRLSRTGSMQDAEAVLLARFERK